MLHMIASEAGTSPVDINWLSLVTTIVVFMLFFAVAATMVWPKILKGLDDRELKIREEIEAAEAARAQAAESLASQEASLAAARKEAKATRARAEADATAHAAELRAKAETELESLRAHAHREIEAAREAAVKDLSNHAAELATAVASRIIGRELNASDQKELIETSLKEIAEAHAG